jgi:molybdenum cofactor biosynthesis enzyme
MTKALDPAIAIERVELVEKIGGKRGLWRRSDTAS